MYIAAEMSREFKLSTLKDLPQVENGNFMKLVIQTNPD